LPIHTATSTTGNERTKAYTNYSNPSFGQNRYEAARTTRNYETPTSYRSTESYQKEIQICKSPRASTYIFKQESSCLSSSTMRSVCSSSTTTKTTKTTLLQSTTTQQEEINEQMLFNANQQERLYNASSNLCTTKSSNNYNNNHETSFYSSRLFRESPSTANHRNPSIKADFDVQPSTRYRSYVNKKYEFITDSDEDKIC